MVYAGGSIEAFLKLNASGFRNGLENAVDAVDLFKREMLNINKNSSRLTEGINQLSQHLQTLRSELILIQDLSRNVNTFNKLANAIHKTVNGLITLQESSINVEQGINTMNSIFKAFQGALNGAEVKVIGLKNNFDQLANSERNVASATRTSVEAQLQAVNSLNNNRNAVMSLITGENQLAVAEKQESVASEQSSVAHNKASASMEKQTASTNRLGKAMSSLRMMGTMVASMMVYNFAHNLITATRETVNAKSEMEGYFQMLGFTTSQIGDFNKALDETVAKFPRLNKYALGETISSIGVEFELTTEEMKKAMPVVSMITSEYLRAGRNVNEASLAVKDILQGEFQRLSRETGVKGDQLIEAGWSGDKTDVMGLLDALEKVGKSRNWDIFVTKANSLNDAVLILQNRFGEWSADMVNLIQPSILGVFNAIMDVGGTFGKMFTNIFTSLDSNPLLSVAIKVGAVSTALIQGLKYLTMYRSGANLLQASTMGLRKALTSLVFGINLETTATHRNYEAIMMKILGLNAEKVAENGLINTINASILRKGMETAQENLNTASKELNAVATATQTTNNIGFVAGLQAVITGKILDTEATLTLSGAMGVLTATMLASPFTWFVAGLMAIAGAVFVLSGGLDDHWDKMKNFNEALDNSDDLVQSNADYLERLGNNLGEDSEWYKMASESVDDFNQKLGSSKALVKAYNDEMASLGVTISTISKMNSQGLGLSKDQLKELSEYATGLDEGYNTYYRALQVLHKQQDDYAKADRTLATNMMDRGVDKDSEDLLNKREQFMEHYNNFMKHSAEHNTSDDWWSGSWAGFLAWVDSVQLWFDFKTEDIANWFHDFNEQWTQFGKDIEESVGGLGDWISGGWNKLQSDFNNWINDVGKSLSDSWKSLEEMWNNNIVQPLQELWGGFWSFDWLFGESVSASDGSTDHPSFMEDISNIIGVDIQSWIDSFTSDPLGTLGIDIPEINLFDLIKDMLTNGLSSDNTGGGSEESTGSSVSKSINIADILRNIVDFSTEGLSQLGWEVASNFGNAVVTGILGIPASLGISDLLNAILNIDVDALGQWVDENIITPLKDAVTLGILNTPVLSGVSDFLGLGEEPQAEAETEGMEIGTSFNTGIQTGLAPVDGIINSAFEGLNLDDITANFTTNTQTMTTNASTTAQSVSGSYTTMKDNQRSALDSMVSHNTTQFEAMKVKSNASLSQMRDSTSNVTSQMTTAWSMMKDSIIASAEKIKTDSSNRFSTLSDRIGGFYRKIQNPSLWGSAGGTPSRRGITNRRVGGSVARALKPNGYGGGLATRSTNATMTVSRLKNELCPDGNCGNIFDGYDPNDIVNVWDFLQTIGEGHGLGGWNFASNHNQYIKTKSDEWKTAPPIIQLLSGIATNTSFKVGEFNEATPKISFSTFQDIATAIFSQIPYRLYFDSSWKGSWLGALQAGACNCYDGALALMALAQTFGFSASMGHGTWTNPDGKQTAHVWAIINGVKMDTTGMQQRGSWNPSASAGGSPTSSGSDKTVNITIDMQGATIYGVEDLDNRIEQGVRRGLREEFNDSYSVII